MGKVERNRLSAKVTGSRDGAGGPGADAAKPYCALCGQPAKADGPAIERFGETFCSEAHAEAFVGEVRAARVQAAAAAAPAAEVERAGDAADGAAKARNWKASLGKALCWGAPLLALVLLVAGPGILAGAASALLPALALLACPLGMYFMMRSMSKKGHDDRGDGRPEK